MFKFVAAMAAVLSTPVWSESSDRLSYGVAGAISKDFVEKAAKSFRVAERSQWSCQFASAVKELSSIRFVANLTVDSTAFGGREVRIRFEGEERDDLDGVYGLVPTNKGLAGQTEWLRVLSGSVSRQVVVGERVKDGVSHKSANSPINKGPGSVYRGYYWEDVYATRSFQYSILRQRSMSLRMGAGGEELLVEVAAQYKSIEGAAGNEFLSTSERSADDWERKIRWKASNPLRADTYPNTHVEWMAVCTLVRS